MEAKYCERKQFYCLKVFGRGCLSYCCHFQLTTNWLFEACIFFLLLHCFIMIARKHLKVQIDDPTLLKMDFYAIWTLRKKIKQTRISVMTHQIKLYLYTMLSKYVSTPLGSMLINSYSLLALIVWYWKYQ